MLVPSRLTIAPERSVFNACMPPRRHILGLTRPGRGIRFDLADAPNPEAIPHRQ